MDNAWVITEYANGARSCLGVCFFAPHHGHEMGVIGENGSLEADPSEFTIKQFSCDSKDIVIYNIEKPKKESGHGGAEFNQAIAFYESIVNGKHIIVDGNVGLLSVAVSIAAQRAINEKKIVDIG